MNEAEWLSSDCPYDMLRFLASRQDDNDLQQVKNDRKMRLFACACAREQWELLGDRRSRRAIILAEKYADGNLLDGIRPEAYRYAHQARIESLGTSAESACWFAQCSVMLSVIHGLMEIEIFGYHFNSSHADILRDIIGNPFQTVTCSPSLFSPMCPDIIALAGSAYSERRPSDGVLDTQRLAVLSDALEEAGCQEKSILDHLRGQEVYQKKLIASYRCPLCDRLGRKHAAAYTLDGKRIRNEKSCTCDGYSLIVWEPGQEVLVPFKVPNLHVRGCWVLDLILGWGLART